MSLTVGLLPLYVALYDESTPQMRPGIEAFYDRIATALAGHGLSVLRAPVCRLEAEFRDAIGSFEARGAQALVTLHLAYSPSLESEAPLAETQLPIIVLDTTPDFLFDHQIDADAISYNHGIHGVQDMCSLLRRNGKPFNVCAGHALHSDVLQRVAECARAVSVGVRMRGARVGSIGSPFGGMGDFQVDETRLARDLGLTVVRYDWTHGAARLAGITDDQVRAEYALDEACARDAGIGCDAYAPTERVGLSVRGWIEDQRLDAFTINFQEAGLHDALPTMPFSEASKAMARGVGYAGEGDVLTAALVGALLQSYQDATFAEMFCPNWRDGSVFLSHMGEINLRALAGTPHMIVKDFPYAPGFDPCCLMGHYKAGAACYVNLAPMKDHYELILADGEMLALPDNLGSFQNAVAGWFKPGMPLERFLEQFSLAGGTHHGAVVYGAKAETLQALAPYIGARAQILR